MNADQKLAGIIICFMPLVIAIVVIAVDDLWPWRRS